MALQIWLPLLGNVNNYGLKNISITNNGAIINDNGKIGKCYSFGTQSSYMTLPIESMNSFTTEASICFWIKILSWNTSYATFFQAGLTSTPWTHYIFGFLRNNATSNCCFTISNSSTSSQNNYKTSDLDLNVWYHITLTYKTGHCCIYINGNLYNDYSTSIVPNFSGITKIAIGKGTNGSSYQTNCLLNDFRIYDHCLSNKEVHEISYGLVLHYKLDTDYKLDNISERNLNLLTPSLFESSTPWNAALQGTETYKDKKAVLIKTNILYTQSGNGANPIFPGLTFKANTQYTLSVTWCDHLRTDANTSKLYLRFKYDDGTNSSSITSPTADNNADWVHSKVTSAAGKTVVMICTTYSRSGDISIAELKLEEGTKDTGLSLTSESIYNANGYVLPISAKRLEYLQSDGTAYINTGIPYNSTKSTYKIECKFSMPSAIGSYDAIFGAYIAEANKCIRIIRGNNNSKLWIYYNNQAGGSNKIILSTANTNIREVIINSTSISVNDAGTITNNTTPTTNGTDTTSTFYLFCQGIVNNAISCISKSRIYYWRLYDNSNIIKEFIPVEYNEQYGMWETVNHQFYPNSNSTGTFTAGPQIGTIYDCSGYGNNGTITGSLTFNNNSSRYNLSTEFNGTSYIYRTPLDASSEIKTISFWANWDSIPSGQSVLFVDNGTKTAFGLVSTGILLTTSGAGSSYTYSKSSLVANTWYHFVIIITGTTTRDLYINGVKQSPTTNTSNWTYSVNELQIGKRSTTSDGFIGKMSDFRMYATVLSDIDILKLYNHAAHIDNLSNLYGFEFDEFDITNPKILKTGIIEINEFEDMRNDRIANNIKFYKNSILANKLIEK